MREILDPRRKTFCTLADRFAMGKEQVLRKFSYFAKKNLSHAFDSMTGVLNRETMTGYIQSLIRNKTQFSLFLIDVDNFKTVNDSYGHQVGDKVLIGIAHYLVEQAGDRCVVGRFGGDEFMMVVENVIEYKDVWWIGHEINKNIRNVHFDDVTGLFVSVTMGIARCPINATTYEDLLRIADKAFYRGKMKGRSCFIIYLEEKHKNINLKTSRDKRYSSSYLCNAVFKTLTGTPDLQANIADLFKHFVSYYMFDHVAIESETGLNMETIHVLSKSKQFEHIPPEVIGSVVNNAGLLHINSTEMVDDTSHGEIIERLKAQNVSAALYCEIAAYGKLYGYLRVDMADKSRIWQAGEMDILVIAANAIGLILHYENKALTEFEVREPIIIGESN